MKIQSSYSIECGRGQAKAVSTTELCKRQHCVSIVLSCHNNSLLWCELWYKMLTIRQNDAKYLRSQNGGFQKKKNFRNKFLILNNCPLESAKANWRYANQVNQHKLSMKKDDLFNKRKFAPRVLKSLHHTKFPGILYLQQHTTQQIPRPLLKIQM